MVQNIKEYKRQESQQFVFSDIAIHPIDGTLATDKYLHMRWDMIDLRDINNIILGKNCNFLKFITEELKSRL